MRVEDAPARAAHGAVGDTAPADGLAVGGLTPFTSIDYPGKLAAVVFVQGCPWRCSYCHNPQLQGREGARGPRWAELRGWLARRVGLIDAVVFSGGEPTLDPALPAAMAEVRALGLAVGLHSAGIYPRQLRALLPLVDWLGLDIKAPLHDDAAYARITGVRGSAGAVRDSLGAVLTALREQSLACETRTTAHPALLSDAALLQIGESLAAQGIGAHAVQCVRRVGQVPSSLMDTGLGDTPAGYPHADTLARLHTLFARFTLRAA